MAFKIPQVNFKRGTRVKTYDGFPVTKDLDVIKTVGRGSFGVVKLCKKRDSTEVILKEMIEADEVQHQLFLKEAKILMAIIHINIVRFDSLFVPSGPGIFGFVMEYMQFDFTLFGQDTKVSSLKEFLRCVNEFNCKEFEHVQSVIAKDVSRGLSFLHDNDIVHRDLKPENILVSNQHYTTVDQLIELWNKKPIVAKLTDFGESRSDLLQTVSLLHTRTNHVNRGTPVYMAPETHLHDGVTHMTMSDLKNIDIWALGLVFYMLVNPDRNYPFEDEVKQAQIRGLKGVGIMSHIFENKTKIPVHSPKYSSNRQTVWKHVTTAFEHCVRYTQRDRPTTTQIQCLLAKDEKHDRNIFEDILNPGAEEDFPEEENGNDHAVIAEGSIMPQQTPVLHPQAAEGNDHAVIAEGSIVPQQTPVLHHQAAEGNDHAVIAEGSIVPQQTPVLHHQAAEEIEPLRKTPPLDEVYLPTEHSPGEPSDCNGHPPQKKQRLNSDVTSSSLPTSKETSQPLSSKEVGKSSLFRQPGLTSSFSGHIGQMFAGSTHEEILSQRIQRSQHQLEPSVKKNWSVRGDFHQASEDVFQHSAAGTQCTSICVVSIIVAALKKTPQWKTRDINNILFAGDKLHLEILKGKGWPQHRQLCEIDIDEVPNEISIIFENKTVVASIGILNNMVCGMIQNIGALLSAVDKENNHVILRMGDKCRAIIIHNGGISLFDPHSCGTNGSVDANGSACMLNFTRMADLAEHLQMLYPGRSDEQVDLSSCDVAILTENYVNSMELEERHIPANIGAEYSGDTEVYEPRMIPEVEAILYRNSPRTSTENTEELQSIRDNPISIIIESDTNESPISSNSSGGSYSKDNPVSIIIGSEISESPICTSSTDGSCSKEATEGCCPAYRRDKKGLSVKDIIQMCEFDQLRSDRICTQIPQPEQDSIFVVDLNTVNINDLSCDDSGTYSSHSSPTVVVKITVNAGIIQTARTISRKKVPINDPILKKSSTFVVKRLYSEKENSLGLGKAKRIISKVYSRNGVSKYAIIQYIGNCVYSNSGHKNSKKNKGPYIRTKPSVISQEKKLISHQQPKQIIAIIDQEKGGPMNMLSCSDGPRDRQQVYNLKRNIEDKHKSRNTGPVVHPDFSRLIADMDTGKFVRNVDFSFRSNGRIHPNTFAISQNSITWLKKFCNPLSEIKAQVGIDMTYKVGPFYTTCLSTPHPYLVNKYDRSTKPTLFVGMMTSTGRKVEDYRYLANQLKSCGLNNLIYGTDGEYALEKGFEQIYPIEKKGKNIKLRCFMHVKDDLLKELKKHNIDGQAANGIVEGILGKENDGVRTPGLVDEDEYRFEIKYNDLSVTWPEDFKTYMESKQLRIRSLKSTLLKSMGKEVRIEAGLGNPPNKFDNQRAESINHVLKESVGGRYVDQSSVHSLVYNNMVLPQEHEIVKAVYGCGEYRLSEEMKKFEIPINTWRTMSLSQRKHHLAKTLFGDITEDHLEKPITRKLSVQPEEVKDKLESLPEDRIFRLWHAAEKVLSHSSINEFHNGNVCIADGESAYVVRQNKDVYTCNCHEFLKISICPHVLVVADEKHCIFRLISKYKYKPSKAVNKHIAKGAGDKKTKKPRKGAQMVKRKPVLKYALNANHFTEIDLEKKRPFQFSEIWHNDEDFKLVYVGSEQLKSRKTLKCISCSNNISRANATAPFDIVITHMERYVYPQKTEDGTIKMNPTRYKQTMKMYCIKRSCVLRRHPYFWKGLLNCDAITPLESHRKLFRDEFNIFI